MTWERMAIAAAWLPTPRDPQCVVGSAWNQSLNAPSPIVVLYMAGSCPIIVRTTDPTETYRNPSISGRCVCLRYLQKCSAARLTDSLDSIIDSKPDRQGCSIIPHGLIIA